MYFFSLAQGWEDLDVFDVPSCSRGAFKGRRPKTVSPSLSLPLPHTLSPPLSPHPHPQTNTLHVIPCSLSESLSMTWYEKTQTNPQTRWAPADANWGRCGGGFLGSTKRSRAWANLHTSTSPSTPTTPTSCTTNSVPGSSNPPSDHEKPTTHTHARGLDLT